MSNNLLLEIHDLHTHFFLDQGTIKAVNGANLQLRRGKTLAVVGESGCGKSITARSILQIVDSPGRVVAGAIRYWRDSGDVLDLAQLHPNDATLRDIRGKEISMIFQEPMTSLSPLYTVGNQIAENARLHLHVSKAEARNLTIEMLRKVGIPRPEGRFDTYPHQLSGGMRQRAMIAMALICQPNLLIADEPTTALDVTTQAQILELMLRLQQELGMAIMIITHDLGVVAEIADDVTVMYMGKDVESAAVQTLFAEPHHPYTRALLRSIPKVDRSTTSRLDTIRGMVPDPLNIPNGCTFHTRCDHAVAGICDREVPPQIVSSASHAVRCFLHGGMSTPFPIIQLQPVAPAPPPLVAASRLPTEALLEVTNLSMHFPIRQGFLQRVIGYVRAVDNVNLTIHSGETLSLVGESGCGKTTTGRCIVRAYQPTGGQIRYRRTDGHVVDLAQIEGEALRPYRKEVRMVFQDPYASLNPRMTVRDILIEPMQAHNIATGSELEDRVAALLKRVGLRPEYMRRYPHAFSGGQRQRISIARALALEPRLVIADEAVSALDVSVRAQILNLLQDLQAEMGLTYLFVAHDLGVVEYISDRVAVMYVGQVVELAPTEQLYAQPRHPYTEALLSAVPKPDPTRRSTRIVLQGEVPDAANPPSGCYFHTRCQYAKDRCKVEAPTLREVAPGHFSACHFAEELELQGVETIPLIANNSLAGSA
jgi:peptide/nickel transport system ATP-binding protein